LLLPPSLLLFIFASVIENGAGEGKKYISSSIPLAKKKRLTKKEREDFNLPFDSKEGQALIGHILGDGCLLRHSPKTAKGQSNARFIYAQSTVREEYFEYVYKLFKPYCQGPSYQYKGNSKLTGPYSGNRFNTLTLPCFNPFYDLFYVNGKKIIPANL